jgi:hypothetical protein
LWLELKEPTDTTKVRVVRVTKQNSRTLSDSERTTRREKRIKGTELRFLIQRTKRREKRKIEGTKLFQSRLKQSSVQNGKEAEIGSGISCLLGIMSESRSAGVTYW